MPFVDGKTCRNKLVVEAIADSRFICSPDSRQPELRDQWPSPAACGAGSADDLAASTIEAMITAPRIPEILADPFTEILESPRRL
jgi:hypothetical protein